MTILRIFLMGLAFYFVYKVVFSVIIPVYRTTKQVRKGFKDMNSRMDEYQQQTQGPQAPGSNGAGASSESGSSKAGEYIDFEEVK